MKTIVPKPQRCAIYTRKSSEHNLDLEFNSLDAQREACEGFDKLSYFACQSFYSATLVLREINDLLERRNAKIASNPLLLT